MRFGALVLVLFVVLAGLVAAVAAGCGGGDNGGSGGDGDDNAPAWSGPQRPLPTDGTVPVDGFADYAEDVDERWERSPVLTAAEFLRLDEAGAPQVEIESDTGPEGGGPAQVTVTLDRLLDDSIQTQRFVLDLTRQGETWRLDNATWSQRCRQGRGHDDFSPESCV